MDMNVAEVPVASHSGSITSNEKPKIKRKKRRRNPRNFFSRKKRRSHKPMVDALEANTSTKTFGYGSVEGNGPNTYHTSAFVKETVDDQFDPTRIKPDINEADQSSMLEIKLESVDYCDTEGEVQSEMNEADQACARAIDISPLLKNTIKGQWKRTFASLPSLPIEPAPVSEGTSRQMTIKNLDSTLIVTIVNDTVQPSPTHFKIPTESNIYSRIDEFRVPLIVDWNNSSSSFVRPTSPLLSVESPLYGPDVMPQFSGISVNLMDTLLEHLKVSLPVPWNPICRKDGVCALLFTTECLPLTSVRRSVFVHYEQGSVQIGIHGKPLPKDHQIWNETGLKFPLCNDNVVAFSNRVVKIVYAVHQLKICPGIESNEINSKIFVGKKDIIFEEDMFENVNGSCFRSNRCSLLISMRRKKCVACSKFADKMNCHKSKTTAKDLAINQDCDETESFKESPGWNSDHDYLLDSDSIRLLKKELGEIELQDETNCRLTARVTKMLDMEGIDIDTQLSKDLKTILENNKLSQVQRIFLQHQIRCSKVTSKTCVVCKTCMRWHPILIRFALYLISTSPVAPDTVRQSGLIRLPCGRALFDYSSIYKPVASNKNIAATKVKGLKEPYERFHCLIFNEITTSQNLVFSKETGELCGYAHLRKVTREMDELQKLLEDEEELKLNCPRPVVKHMLTFMIKGTASGVKEAVASYLITNLTKEQLFLRTWELIGSLELVGVPVVALISNNNPVSNAFYQMHVPVTKNDNGIVFDTLNYCSGDGRPLYFFTDVSHLLKCIKSNFMSSGRGLEKTCCLIKNEQIITWDTIMRMYMEEEHEAWSNGFILNEENVFPDSYSRMRDPVAAQVRRNTVSKMIDILEYEECEETAIFIKKVNDFFDMLNGTHSDEARETSNPNLAKYDSPHDTRFTELLGFLNYLQEWKEEAHAATKTRDFFAARQLSLQIVEGIERTVLAFIGCTKLLLANGQKFVMAQVFSQHPLELHLHHHNTTGGGDRNLNKAEKGCKRKREDGNGYSVWM
ncbi:uncharacterized protein LOC117646547 [Thrips palmi]|uniref:Uncharacterized protein LOC117646547 n=1 Tax=Thrips palmi TaxID=161013 RepID=A0A6P8ZP46_THRPL|nr:uncharacterized protein LOC117646547 [Thrips palmi]